jgi:NAD(P)-dependent dehydrogenase (short-subunit alcohol dehydrogenase family)
MRSVSLCSFFLAFGKCYFAFQAGRQCTDYWREKGGRNLPKARKKKVKNLFGTIIPIYIPLPHSTASHSTGGIFLQNSGTFVPIQKRLIMHKLQGKIAVITGGNSGIGYATAEAFIAEGAKVVITGRNADAVAEAAKNLGHGTIGIVNDAAKMDDLRRIDNQLKAQGIEKVDVLFYNAGVAQFAPLADMSLEVYEANMNINFRGAFFTVQSLLPMLNDGGSIIFNGTFLGHGTMAGNSAYGASKAALIHLAKTLGVELAGRKIRANTISPGAISTPIYTKLGMDSEQLSAFAASFIPKIPLARFGESAEIAKAAVFFASDDSSYVTGSELLVDGGTGVQW